MGVLHTLDLENFKSYRGKQVIGPFKRFTAIVGPNGSGKSNLMDAISFVLGEKATSLRVKKLGDLIHGAPIGKPVSNRCSVTLNYKDDSGRMRSFSRSVTNAGSEFRVDGKIVSVQQYNHEMETIQIFIKAKNFLVYQGQIESIAMKNPKERTALFEEISRLQTLMTARVASKGFHAKCDILPLLYNITSSCELQQEYDRLKAELQKAEDDAQQNMNKRRGIAQEKREAKLERDEAEKYQHMKDDLAAKQRLLFLLELFYCERYGKLAQEELVQRKNQVADLEMKKNEIDDLVNEKQKQVKRAQRDNHKLEKDISDKEREISHQRPLYVQVKQEALHVKTKLETSNKTLNAAQKLAERNEEQVEMLEKSARELERKKAECKAELESQSQELDLHLSEEQINEYVALKREAGKKSGIIDMQLNSMRQEHETDRSSKVNEERRMKAWQEKIKNKRQEIERLKKQIEYLTENAEQQKVVLQDEKANLVTMEKQVKESKEKLEKVSVELTEINKQLSDASGDSAESERVRRRNEAIENLKRVFPEKIHGRLVDLCQPSHKRFNVAVTKVLQKHMMSIVCDSEDTARDAIMYLKEQRYPPETFLPHHGLDVHPINEKLRELTYPKGVKLVYDVIQCNHPAARKALQFASGNALICETAEDARTLAYGGAGGDRYKAVSLDGTMFQQSGVIGGGSHELKIRARKWDENALRQLRERRAQLLEESNTLHRTRRKELDVEMQRNKLTSVEYRLRNMQLEKTKCETDTLNKLSIDLESLESELSVIPPKIEEIEERMVEREREIKKLEDKCNAVADDVFVDFCCKVGIKNIREYEEREMRFHQERIDRLREFDNELDRVRNEIEYLRSEDRNRKVKQEIDKVKNLEKELDVLKKKETKEGKVLSRLEKELEDLKIGGMEKKTEQEQYEAELAAVKKEAQAAQRDVTSAEKAVLALESVVGRKYADRHALLHSAKINQIQVPLLSGSLADVDAEEEEDGDGSQPSNSNNLSQEQIERESKIKVNYKQLPENLKEVRLSIGYRFRIGNVLKDEDEVKRHVERMNKEINDAQAALSRLNAPNLKANQRMEEVKEREAETTEECEMARKKARKIRGYFEKVKTERYRKFQECFEPVSQKIDEIYKSLSRNASAQAFLGADNMEEPYLEGIQYNCVAPGKRFRPMDNLSGGEKTVAALALLFAMHARNPSPFFVLDEIDAALDNTNIGKVSSFICESARNDMQIIIISLKEEFYNKADALIGIYPEQANCSTSGVLTFDLTSYKQTGANDSNMSMMETTVLNA
ncbi:RecF/RecN/SMC protein [Dictyocaulus viviparus]|uniref:Structural maintenance of chromosomes protein n=1 Tax=Dictyocaulus viviparus TaxID=29172 RepID=A0A0D8XW66_DICVI|nr:RecF/RecN/SMC protein [Dictyocaulus viviparus]